MLKELRRKWCFLAFLIILMAAACGGEGEAGLVLERLENVGPLSAPVKSAGDILVYEEDVPGLRAEIDSVSTLLERRDLVEAYLTRRDRIRCILEDVEKASEEGREIRCGLWVLVEEEEVPRLLEEVGGVGSGAAQRDFLAGYLHEWKQKKRVSAVMNNLAQKRIPVFGKLTDLIHRFPIVSDGEMLVPWKDRSDLRKQLLSLSTEEARRDMVEEYLDQRSRLLSD